MRSVCFTGHRTIKSTAEIEKRLSDTLERLIVQDEVTDFYAGGAYGWDIICEMMVIRLRERHPKIKLHLILPCPADEQTAKWSSQWKKKYKYVYDKADSVEIVSEHYHNGCMRARNERLVELADICVCYYNESNRRSGTGQTVRMAKQKDIKVINCYYMK